MRKLLASDVDGTLYVNQSIHEKSLEYIKDFRKEGHAFLLCTGRNLSGAKILFKDYEDLELDGFILCNGAVVVDSNFNIIHNETVDDKTIKRAFEEAKENGLYDFYFADVENFYIVEGYNDHPMLSAADVKDKMQVIRLKEEDFYNTEYSANVIGIHRKDKDINKANEKIEMLEEVFGGSVSMFRNQSFIDIVAKGASKSKGISKALDAYNVVEDNVFVIGDSWNDVSMFEKFDNSYTFSYAEEGVKPYANNIVDNFYNCLEEILAK